MSYLKLIAYKSTDMHYGRAGRHTHVRVVIRTCVRAGYTTCSFVEPIVCDILVPSSCIVVKLSVDAARYGLYFP